MYICDKTKIAMTINFWNIGITEKSEKTRRDYSGGTNPYFASM